MLQALIIGGALLYRFNSDDAYASQGHSETLALAGIEDEASTLRQSLIPEVDKPIEPSDDLILYTVSPGDTLSKIWAKFSSVSNGGLRAADAFKDAGVSVNALRVGNEISLKLSAGDISRFDMKLPEGRSITLTGSSTEGYQAELKIPKIIEKERTVSYPIFSSFSASAQEVNVPLDIVDDLVDLFSGRINFRRDIQPGDSFTIIYNERTTEDGERLSPGKVKAISIETSGKLLVAIKHIGKDGTKRYFDENGERLGGGFLQYPLRFSRISSIFSKSRFHPVLKVSRPHNGVDFAAPVGTPVRSVGDGTVEFSGYSSGNGYWIKIKHCKTYSTAYLHLSKIASSVKKGAKVSRGQVIGNVGMTGLATGPHLHFSLYENNKYIDPLNAKIPVITEKDNTIPKTYLASTLEILKQQHELIRLAYQMGFAKNA